MSQLIALVATAVVVDGVRTIIQPGEKLPELSPHDARELQQSGAAENPADTAALKAITDSNQRLRDSLRNRRDEIAELLENLAPSVIRTES